MRESWKFCECCAGGNLDFREEAAHPKFQRMGDLKPLCLEYLCDYSIFQIILMKNEMILMKIGAVYVLIVPGSYIAVSYSVFFSGTTGGAEAGSFLI